ncbi:MAG: acyltransferase family protein [Agriterribacter sp.]
MKSSPLEKRFDNNFTFLRHIAALLVITGHSYGLLERSSDEFLSKITGYSVSLSQVGLAVFFFISGFLVTQSYFLSTGLTHFFWKRILRIYPALIILIIITVFAIGPVFTTNSIKSYFVSQTTWEYFVGGISLVRLRFFLPGVFNEHGVNGSLWSLPVEFRLYLMLGFLLTFFVRKNKILMLAVWASFLMTTILQTIWDEIFLLGFLRDYISWGTYFFTGTLFFFYKERIALKYQVVVVLLGVWLATKNFGALNITIKLLLISYTCLFFAFKVSPIARNFFKQNDFSYSLYIYAFSVQQILIQITGSGKLHPLLLSLLTLIILIPICWLSWSLIEKPAMRWKDRFVRDDRN